MRKPADSFFQHTVKTAGPGALPIINENDTVSTEEIVIGDNDTLSARVAAVIHGNLLVLPSTASVGDVVAALNSVGATPRDIITILQAMKAAGALHAEMELI